MSDYRPVDCDTHSRYEEAILLRRRLRLRWRTPAGETREAVARPLDVFARAGEEFLRARTESGEELALRLDWIHSAEPVSD